MGGPSQAQTGGLSFLTGLFGAAKPAVEKTYEDEGQRQEKAQSLKAMTDLKNRELGIAENKGRMKMETANQIFHGAGAPYHVNEDTDEGVVTHLVGSWMEAQGRQRALAQKAAGAKRPMPDMQKIQNQARLAAKEAIGKAYGAVALEDLPPSVAALYNKTFTNNMSNDVGTFERLNGIKTGVTVKDPLVIGQASSGLGGYFGSGHPKIKNKVNDNGYEVSFATDGSGQDKKIQPTPEQMKMIESAKKLLAAPLAPDSASPLPGDATAARKAKAQQYLTTMGIPL